MQRPLAAILLGFSFLLTSPSVIAQKSSSQKPPQKNASAGSQGNPDVKVWANVSSKTYHCPGARFYGKTKHGEYMTQRQAQEKGYRPARGKFCR